MEGYQPVLSLENFDYNSDVIQRSFSQNEYLFYVRKINEYTTHIAFMIFRTNYGNYPIPSGAYYITGQINQDLFNYQYLGTMESDDVPDIMVVLMENGNNFKQGEFNLELNKLDPEKFPLFFV